MSQAVQRATLALRCVCANLPHLAGLAHAVELVEDPRIETAAVTPSGLILLNPEWVSLLSLPDATFVMAHELLHLALKHHSRSELNVDPWLANVAADCVINDMLCQDLGMEVPCNGVHFYGARHLSTEEMIIRLQSESDLKDMNRPAWTDPGRASNEPTALGESLVAAGLAQAEALREEDDRYCGHDLISRSQEAEWYPEATQRAALVRAAAEKVLPLAALRESLAACHRQGTLPGRHSSVVEALKTHYRPPWEMAVQKWMETTVPSGRTWARASRRGAHRTDVVLPGRSRQGWTLNLVLDTSGSMTMIQSYVLGVIASFCEAMNIGDIRVLQCDTEVSVDERISPEQLSRYTLSGYGGSDMSPAMLRLAQEPEVEAAVVITDGYINYPPSAPYRVLWALTSHHRFRPGYGAVIPLLNK